MGIQQQGCLNLGQHSLQSIAATVRYELIDVFFFVLRRDRGRMKMVAVFQRGVTPFLTQRIDTEKGEDAREHQKHQE